MLPRVGVFGTRTKICQSQCPTTDPYGRIAQLPHSPRQTNFGVVPITHPRRQGRNDPTRAIGQNFVTPIVSVLLPLFSIFLLLTRVDNKT